MKAKILVPLIACVLAGCGAGPTHRASEPLDDRAVSVRAAIGDTLRLRPGQVAEVGVEPLRILFIGISGDSRCPRGVDCVWAGDAAAELQISLPGAPAVDVTLHTHGGPAGGPGEAAHDGHVVTLLDVEPYPVYLEHIAPSEYVVLLRVTRP